MREWKVTYTEHTDGFEFTRSSALHLVAILLIEILLFIGIIYCIIEIDSPANFILAIPLLFFSLILALGIGPAINAYKNGHKILIWGANKNGLLMPPNTSSFTEYLPPLVVSWTSINRAIFTKILIDNSINSETSTSKNILVVELESKKRIFLSYPEALEYELLSFFSSYGHCENRTHKTEELEIH